MRTILYLLTTLGVISLAFWAYRENYATQGALAETRELRGDIREAHERLSMLKAEWAYLNRPDRVQDLAQINFDRLGLLPLRPEQFGQIEQVTYPPDPIAEITDIVEVANLDGNTAEAGQ